MLNTCLCRYFRDRDCIARHFMNSKNVSECIAAFFLDVFSKVDPFRRKIMHVNTSLNARKISEVYEKPERRSSETRETAVARERLGKHISVSAVTSCDNRRDAASGAATRSDHRRTVPLQWNT
jgi:hypothetical protein